jgi:prolipoprotein diacylglyceryltransferase
VHIPFEPHLFGYALNVHLLFEYAAFFFAFRYYIWLRKKSADTISQANRLSIILGAVLGALIGSRIMGILENPLLLNTSLTWIQIFNMKTIMGGLFGGLLGVEIAKKIIGERQSSGDLFVQPIVLGIFIGRIGCLLNGTKEFAYGTPTSSNLGMNLGDGILRHPIALYEMGFLAILFVFFQTIKKVKLPSGDRFKWFMLSYFAFRFGIEWLKPNLFFLGPLSSIQWLCVLCWIYYLPFLFTSAKYATTRLHVL